LVWQARNERKPPIPMRIKLQVYERAEGTCEKCGTPLEMNEGDFHHLGDPANIPSASRVRFLCLKCHRKYGHKWRQRKEDMLFPSFGMQPKAEIIRRDPTKTASSRKKRTRKRKKTWDDQVWDSLFGKEKTRKPKSTLDDQVIDSLFGKRRKSKSKSIFDVF